MYRVVIQTYSRTTQIFNFMLVLIFSLFMLVTAVSADQSGPDECIGCHEDVYLKAISNKYQHSILREKCTFCHVQENPEGELELMRNFKTLQQDQIIYLKDLSKDQLYGAEISATGYYGARSQPRSYNLSPGSVLIHEQLETVNQISDISVDEIQKGAFVRAVISWNTDSFSSSEIEYSADGNSPYRFISRDIYTTRHRIVLRRLKGNSIYSFKVISRDLHGNSVESADYSIDTSQNFTAPDNYYGEPLSIDHMQAFRVVGREGLFLKVSANRPSELRLRVTQVKEMDPRHGFGLLPARHIRIDVCVSCHPRGTSHPVGVRSEGKKIRTPDELPTIENGVITCVTCHMPHGGSRAYFNRYDRNRDICVLCHIGGY